jgi:hypothetical protein
MQFLDMAQHVRKSADEEPRRCDYETLSTPINQAENAGNEFVYSEGQQFYEVDPSDAAAPFSKRGLLGLKRIALFGSIVCVANNIAGPGMVVLPRVYQEAGWVVPSAVLVMVCIASSLAATYLVDTMARIPGNARFQRRIEFVNIFEEYWGTNGLRVAQAMFIVNMMAQVTATRSNRA